MACTRPARRRAPSRAAPARRSSRAGTARAGSGNRPSAGARGAGTRTAPTAPEPSARSFQRLLEPELKPGLAGDLTGAIAPGILGPLERAESDLLDGDVRVQPVVTEPDLVRHHGPGPLAGWLAADRLRIGGVDLHGRDRVPARKVLAERQRDPALLIVGDVGGREPALDQVVLVLGQI